MFIDLLGMGGIFSLNTLLFWSTRLSGSSDYYMVYTLKYLINEYTRFTIQC